MNDCISANIPTSGWGYNEMIATLAGGIPLIVRGVNSRNMGHMWLYTPNNMDPFSKNVRMINTISW